MTGGFILVITCSTN